MVAPLPLPPVTLALVDVCTVVVKGVVVVTFETLAREVSASATVRGSYREMHVDRLSIFTNSVL